MSADLGLLLTSLKENLDKTNLIGKENMCPTIPRHAHKIILPYPRVNNLNFVGLVEVALQIKATCITQIFPHLT